MLDRDRPPRSANAPRASSDADGELFGKVGAAIGAFQVSKHLLGMHDFAQFGAPGLLPLGSTRQDTVGEDAPANHWSDPKKPSSKRHARENDASPGFAARGVGLPAGCYLAPRRRV